MTTASATPWPEAPRTGLDALLALVTDPPPPTSRALWDLLHRAYPHAARQLSRTGGALRTSSRFRGDLTDRDIERIVLAWTFHASVIVEDVHRALMSSPRTLLALASGARSPIHPDERRTLTFPVTRRLLVLGFVPNEVAERRIAEDTIAAIRDALQRLHP